MSWYQVKTAWMIDEPGSPLTEAIVNDRIFPLMQEVDLPPNWEFRGTDISGAAGFVLIFDTYSLPTREDLDQIEKVLSARCAGNSARGPHR